MSTKAELACVYASLILVDDDVAVTVSSANKQNKNVTTKQMVLEESLNISIIYLCGGMLCLHYQ